MEILRDRTGIFWSIKGIETFGPDQLTPSPPSFGSLVFKKMVGNPSFLAFAFAVDNAAKNDLNMAQIGWFLVLACEILHPQKVRGKTQLEHRPLSLKVNVPSSKL